MIHGSINKLPFALNTEYKGKGGNFLIFILFIVCCSAQQTVHTEMVMQDV
jgi:hypothetical protein